MRLVGAGDFEVLPDIYWKSRIMFAEILDADARAFIELAGEEEAAYYEIETRDRRYSLFPNHMYMGAKGGGGYKGVPELADIRPPETGYEADWDYTERRDAGVGWGKAGGKIARRDGRYEEYWKYGEPYLIRSAEPIAKRETEGELSAYRNIYPYEKGEGSEAYRSVGRRLDWNYGHRLVRDGEDMPVDGEERYKDAKVVMRFKRGYLDGDARHGGIIRPAYEEEGHKEYWRGGLLHRDGGRAAVISEKGAIKEWWVNGVFIRGSKDK
jgi:hypothetical protein